MNYHKNTSPFSKFNRAHQRDRNKDWRHCYCHACRVEKKSFSSFNHNRLMRKINKMIRIDLLEY